MNLCKIVLKNVLKSHSTRSNYLNNVGSIAFYSSEKYNKNDQRNDSGERKKTARIPKISLIHEDSKMEVVTMDQAKKIAEKRQLKLVNIIDFDSKSSRPVFKLMTSHEYHAEELKKREEKKIARNQPHIKSEKLLSISNKITDHDLNAKINKCKVWIKKMHEVRVVISSDDGDMTKAEKVCGTIEKEMKEVEGRVLQKRNKDNTIKFTIMPTIKKDDQNTKGSAENHEKKLLEPENLNVQQVRSLHLF